MRENRCRFNLMVRDALSLYGFILQDEMRCDVCQVPETQSVAWNRHFRNASSYFPFTCSTLLIPRRL